MGLGIFVNVRGCVFGLGDRIMTSGATMRETMSETEDHETEGLPKGFFETEIFSMTPDPRARNRQLPDSEDDED